MRSSLSNEFSDEAFFLPKFAFLDRFGSFRRSVVVENARVSTFFPLRECWLFPFSLEMKLLVRCFKPFFSDIGTSPLSTVAGFFLRMIDDIFPVSVKRGDLLP